MTIILKTPLNMSVNVDSFEIVEMQKINIRIAVKKQGTHEGWFAVIAEFGGKEFALPCTPDAFKPENIELLVKQAISNASKEITKSIDFGKLVNDIEVHKKTHLKIVK